MGDGRPAARPGIRIWHRLWFRLGLVMVILLGTAAWVGPKLHLLLFRWVAGTTMEDLLRRSQAEFWADRFLANPWRDSRGDVRARADDERIVGLWLLQGSLAYVWLDPEDRIVSKSAALSSWKRGTVFTDALLDPLREKDSKALPHPIQAVRIPRTFEDQLAGTFVVFRLPTPPGKELPPSPPGPVDHILAMDRQAAAWFGTTVAVLVAVVMGILLARLVTSRLSRLATAATGNGPAEKTTSFVVHGRDEIAALGNALEAMRLRIRGLVTDLAGRDTARRELVAQISHDLRTPLVALLDSLDSASEHASVRSDPGLRDWIAAARLDADRVLSMADDLLELARLDIGQELRLEDVFPEEMVSHVVRGLRPMAERRGLRIETQFSDGLPTLRADGRRLKRVLENLLRNAIQYARRAVLVSVTMDGGRVRFVVQDDGPGIGGGEEGDGAAAAPRADSSGLGLKVAQRVVSAHGGNLWIENGPEGGARVGWLMPLAGAGPARGAEREEPPA